MSELTPSVHKKERRTDKRDKRIKCVEKRKKEKLGKKIGKRKRKNDEKERRKDTINIMLVEKNI